VVLMTLEQTVEPETRVRADRKAAWEEAFAAQAQMGVRSEPMQWLEAGLAQLSPSASGSDLSAW
jgi:hypothetical protein